MNKELNKKCDKKSWKTPELIIMSVQNDTENNTGMGGDGGPFYSNQS
ncbi:hypothetical protein [Clostridium sp. AWRP]|nr:hypothetical protein [Clostridium sp. AWRP]